MAEQAQQQLSDIEKATNIYTQMNDEYTGQMSGDVNQDPSSSGYGYTINRTGSTPTGFSGSYSTPTGNLITIGAPPTTTSQQSSGSQQQSGGSGGSGGGVSYSYDAGYQGPYVEKPTYQAPEFQAPDPYKAPEYTPPERDESEEKALRQEYMSSGLSSLRRSMSQSILSANNIDNPNARALFINKALEGMGAGLSEVASTAGREASTEASNRYNTELQNYYNSFVALTDEAKTNYETEWNSALLEYQQQIWGAQSDYTGQMGVFSQMPLDYQASQYGEEGASGGSNPVSWSYNRF